jgi:hypothetical protein
MANLAGTHPARHAERDGGFRQVLLIALPSETVLTQELATAWCRDTATGTWGAYRSRAVREFGKYLQLTGVEGFIVPSAWIASPVRSLPHIFTDDELAAFFRAADSFDGEYRSPFREYTIPVIFRLILGAGLRPPEARRLRRRDVDADNAMVMIERSKRNKDRRSRDRGPWPGCLPASTTWRICGARTGSGSSRTSAAASTPQRGSSPATTAAANVRAGSRLPQPRTRCGTITPRAP